MGNCCQATYASLMSLASGQSSSAATARAAAVGAKLDSRFVGVDVEIEGGKVVCGEGTAICDTPMEQTHGYWEYKVLALPAGATFSVGVVRKTSGMKPPPDDKGFFSGQLGAHICSKGLQSKESGYEFGEGDVLGIALSLDDKYLKFYHQGKRLPLEIKLEPKYTLPYPAVSVSGGAKIEVNFAGAEERPFQRQPEALLGRGYVGILRAQSLI